MPKKIDPQLRARCVRLVREHQQEYPTLTAATAAVARQEGVSRESVRRWLAQADVDDGTRPGVTSEESAEVKRLKAENKQLREDNEILRRASNFLRGGARPPKPLILAFIDEMRAEGYAVESILCVLRQQGLEIAARTYRSWKRPARIASRTVTDALVEDKIRDLAWTVNEVTGQVQMTPEGLYGRRKWVALLRRQEGLAGTSRGAVDRAMRTVGLEGVRRAKKLRTTIPGPEGKRAGDLLNRDFTATAPNRVWVTDFTYVRTWAGFVYVAFVLDVFAQRIVGWHASASKKVDLVMTPLRIALWQREREGTPVSPGDLIHHSNAGSQYTAIRLTEHLALEGIAPSIGSVRDAYDNALMETVNGLFKTECVRTTVFHAGPFRTLADVEFATAGWVDWYNNRRIHSSLGMLTPIEFETLHHEALDREPEPAK
ncbi:IS3 family transposase [Brachybacterium sp. GU-2]|uniref:IS3 family transposase n=1 Tax=Brachybacterium sp. GU-2 TaxID=3069708 RepID=UPI00280AF584|nr:IS3 family transposase [Brachybacterium sp. GU-2]WME24438.1 IS3 family transposase [Brachybacterium sp. GU-2]